jgi:hypothetical protein
MKKLMSLAIILMMLTTISNYAATPVLISAPIGEEIDAIQSFIEKEDKIISGDFIRYENDTLYIQLEAFEYETSIYDADGRYENTLKSYEKNEEIILYVKHGEATFQLLDVLPKDSQKFYGQIKSIDEKSYAILSGDIVQTYHVLNSDRHFVEDQFIKGYIDEDDVYLMPTIDTSNKEYNSFGALVEKNIIIDGKTLEKNITLINGNVMIPLRETLETLGYEVKWNNDTYQVDIHKLNQWTSIKINENKYFKNKMAHQPLSHAPVIIDGSTYVPVEFLNVILDLGLSIDDGNLTIAENDMAIHSGYIQKINYKANGEISITLSSKEMPDTLSDLTVIHASTNTTYFNTSLDHRQFIHVISPPIMTMSLPGQTSGIIIY